MVASLERLFDMPDDQVQKVLDAVDQAVQEDKEPRIVSKGSRARPLRQRRKNRMDQVLLRCLVAAHFRVELVQKMRIKDMVLDGEDSPHLLLRWKESQNDVLRVEIDGELAHMLKVWVHEYRKTARIHECVFTPSAKRGKYLAESYVAGVFPYWCREVGISLREISGW